MFVQTTYHNLHSLQTRAVPRLFSSLKARPSLPVSSHLPHRTISLLSFQHFTSSISLQPLATVSVFATALALLNSNRNHLSCEDVLTPPPSSSQDSVPPESILSIQKLSFGAVSGVCVGIFIRKGLRLIGFLCGASFVFLQVDPYLHLILPSNLILQSLMRI